MSQPITIPADSIDAVRLIIEEAGGVLAGHAERMHQQAAPDDWKTKTAAFLTADHVKKLSWVYSLLEEPAPCAECSLIGKLNCAEHGRPVVLEGISG